MWFHGKKYDITTGDGREEIMDKIDNCRRRGAANDLSMLCYALLSQFDCDPENSENKHE